MKILTLGSNGQLGSEIKDLVFNYSQAEFIFKDLPELNICNYESLQNFISDHNISAVINCAAYTAVDKAEEFPNKAEQVNANGVLNLINALKKVNGKLIHISTDYVFNGDHFVPYKESDSVSPISVYGKTKRKGELAVISSELDAIVIRTSWLHSSYGDNFVKTMLRLGKQKEELNVVFDQLGTPTYARDLAKTILDILFGEFSENISKNGNIYHYTNEGIASWYDFAVNIMKISGESCKVKPVNSEEYHTLAKRPKYSVLNKSKIKRDFKIKIPYWEDSLEDCIKKIIN